MAIKQQFIIFISHENLKFELGVGKLQTLSSDCWCFC